MMVEGARSDESPRSGMAKKSRSTGSMVPVPQKEFDGIDAVDPEWQAGQDSGGKSSHGSGGALQRTVVTNPNGSGQALMRADTGSWLLVCMGENVGRRYPLHDHMLLGRAEVCDVVLADDRVSARHCEVQRQPSGGFRIKDLGSSNGTLVNAQKTSETELRDGDLVQVGYTVFKFLAPALASIPSSTLTSRVERISPDPQVLSPQSSASVPQAQVVVQTAPSPPADQEMNLEEMVGNARRVVDFFLPYRKLIGILAVVGMVAGLVSFAARPPGAKAQFDMNIISTIDRETGSVFADRAQAAESNFSSTGLIARTLKELGETPTPDGIALVQRRLQFYSRTPSYGGGVQAVQSFHGEFDSSSSDAARKFLETHVRIYIESEVEKTTKIITTKLDYLNEQIIKAETDLKKSDEELKEFKKKYLDSLPENAARSQENLFELQKTESELSSSVEQLKLEIQSASSTGGWTSRKAKAIAAAKEEIAEAKSQGLGDNHPDVVALREKMARLEAAPEDTTAIGRSGDKSLGQLRAELEAKRMQLEQTRTQLEQTKTAMATLPEFEARYNDLTRSYDASKRLYDRLAEDKNQAEYQLGFEKTAAEARFEVTKPPQAEAQSKAKAAAKRMVIFGGGATMLGLAWALFRHIMHIWKNA